MEKFGITSGKWTPTNHYVDGVEQNNIKVMVEGRVTPVAQCFSDFMDGTPKANARLIAQAPAMLEALIQDSITCYERDLDNPMYSGKPPIKHKELIELVVGRTWAEVREACDENN